MGFDEIRFANAIVQVCSSLSIAGSCYLLATALAFPVIRSRRYIRMIFLISLCDLLGNIVAVWGIVPSESVLCAPQAVIRIFFFRASWLWTTMLASQLYTTVIYGFFWMKESSSHIFIWGLSIFMTCIPLSTSQYGQDDEVSKISWCAIKGDEWASVWSIVTVGLPLALCIIISASLISHLYIHFQSKDLSQYPQIQAALTSLRLYPTALVITWLLATIMAPVINFGSNQSNRDSMLTALVIGQGLGALYGFLVACIFFVKSKESAKRWKQLFEQLNSSIQKKFTVDKNVGVGSGEATIAADFQEDYRDLPKIVFGFSIISTSTSTWSFNSFMTHRNHNNTVSNENGSMNELRSLRFLSKESLRISSLKIPSVRNPIRKESTSEIESSANSV